MKKFRHRLLLIATGLPLLLAGLLALAPFWVPWAARPLARSHGVEWEQLRRSGWRSYATGKLTVTGDSHAVTVNGAVVPQPLAWIAGRHGLAPHPEAAAERVVVRLMDAGSRRDSSEATGAGVLDQIRETLVRLLPWTPRCSVQALEVIAADGSTVIQLRNLVLDGRSVRAELPGQAGLPDARLLAWLADDAIRLDAAVPDEAAPLQAHIRIAAPRAGSIAIEARLISGGVPLTMDARVPAGDWLPEKVRARARDWPVPQLVLARVARHPDSLLADLDAELDGRAFDAQLRLVSEGGLPGVEPGRVVAEMRAGGDPEHIQIAAFSIQSSWLKARLSDPLGYSLKERQFTSSASFEVEADLSGQARFPVGGILRANGTFSYPGREISARCAFELAPDSVAALVAQPQILDPIVGEVALDGQLDALRHSGTIRPVRISAPGMREVTLVASWRGTGLDQAELSLQARSDRGGEAEARALVSRGPGDGRINIRCDALELLDPDRGRLATSAPFTVELEPGNAAPLRSVGPFLLAGNGISLAAAYEAEGPAIRASGAAFDLRWLEGWLDLTAPPVILQSGSASLTRISPFLEASIQADLRGADADVRGLSLMLAGRLGSGGIQLDSLEGRLGDTRFIQGNLQVPVLVHTEQVDGRHYSTVAGEFIRGTLAADITPELAARFPQIPAINSIPELRVDIRAGGTPDKPEATLQLELSRIDILGQFDQRLTDFPVEHLSLSARLDTSSIELRALELALQDARVSASGSLPMASARELLEAGAPDWRRLLDVTTLSLQVENLNARAFAALLPGFMRPAGRLDATLDIRPGVDASGVLRARGFSVRPTLFSQPIDDINLLADLRGTRLTLAEAGAAVGRSAVALAGHLDFTDWRKPVFALLAKGERIPLLRTPDLMLVGDLDLRLDGSDAGAPATLAGRVALRDSLLLLEIDPLAAQTTGRGLPVPPFFSVARQPFAAWRLDVAITGEDCLRFKSPYAKALVSVQAAIEGTLANPVWVGSVSSSTGTIDFPGMRADLSRSEIFVTRERQDILQLDLNATGQAASYVIGMTVSGTTADPHVAFAATPDLSNSGILQLLATGSANRSGVGSVGLYLGKGLLNPGTGSSLWDRVSIEIGRDVTETDKDTVDLYYDITGKVRLHGEYDKYDAQNISLEWEVFSR